MAECALAIVADCSAMSLLTMAICARRTASCVSLRWSCIVNPLRFPLNHTRRCFKIAREGRRRCELISAKPGELPIKARAIALICPGALALSEEFGSLQFV